MSTALPNTELPIVPPSASVNRDPLLLQKLLSEQQDLSAVEQFSEWHSTHDDADTAAAPAQEPYYRSLMPAAAPGPGQQLAFEVDLNACSGCKACVVACHTMNGLEEDESWRRVGTLVIGDPDYASPAAIQHVTTACHHCEDPGCLNGCPVKAYDKDPVTGIVRHLDDQCIGCKYCTMMCPYEVPQYSDRLGIVRKCDMCHQRLSVGEAPACVQSCPNEAIKITVVDVGQTASIGDAVVPSAPVSSITQPTTIYKSDRPLTNANAVPQDNNIDQVAESHWPLAVMLVATQISVGVLVTELIVSTVLLITGNQVPASVMLTSAIVAFAIGNAGLGIAPLHLGQPLRMWRVFLGLKTSWLSREAVVLGKFMGLLAAGIGVAALPLVWDWIPESIQSFIPTEYIPSWAGRALLVLAIPVGLAGLYCSAMIYIATQRPLWRSKRTLPRFFGTAIVSGPVIVAAIFAWFGFGVTAAWLCLSGCLALGWKWLLERRVYLAQPESQPDLSDPLVDLDRRSRRLVFGPLKSTASARVMCIVTSLALSFIAALMCIASPSIGGSLAIIAALLLIAGENMERLLYFQSVVYDRMPGTLQ